LGEIDILGVASYSNNWHVSLKLPMVLEKIHRVHVGIGFVSFETA
jgi:hypothetical protein